MLTGMFTEMFTEKHLCKEILLPLKREPLNQSELSAEMALLQSPKSERSAESTAEISPSAQILTAIVLVFVFVLVLVLVTSGQ